MIKVIVGCLFAFTNFTYAQNDLTDQCLVYLFNSNADLKNIESNGKTHGLLMQLDGEKQKGFWAKFYNWLHRHDSLKIANHALSVNLKVNKLPDGRIEILTQKKLSLRSRLPGGRIEIKGFKTLPVDDIEKECADLYTTCTRAVENQFALVKGSKGRLFERREVLTCKTYISNSDFTEIVAKKLGL